MCTVMEEDGQEAATEQIPAGAQEGAEWGMSVSPEASGTCGGATGGS